MAGKIVVDTLQIDATTSSFQVLGNTGSLIFSMTNNGNAVINTNNANDALRITQTGTGNALVVEDSTNPDSSPFVINSDGGVIVGYTTKVTGTGPATATSPVAQVHGTTNNASSLGLYNWSSTGSLVDTLSFNRSLSNTIGTFGGAVTSGVDLGAISFSGDDGTSFIEGARIFAEVDGTPGTNDMPGRLVFSTSAATTGTLTERMRIDSQGRIGFNSTSLGGGSGQYRFAGNITGSTSCAGLLYSPSVQSDVTVQANIFATQPSTQDAAFTLSDLRHFFANQGTITGGSRTAPTNQYGFIAHSTLTGATNNYGFYSNIASGTGRWNFYANGTAANYFAGKLGLGTTAPSVGLELLASDILGSSISSTCNDSSASAGPFITLYRNSPSPAASDIMGAINFYGNNSVGSVISYAAIESAIVSPTGGAESGVLLFNTYSAGTYAESGRISATGGYVLRGGVTSPGGVGITFPATQSASSDANTLDDYEEGTWTAVVADNTSGGNTGSVTLTNALYTKIGRQVTLTAVLSNIITTSMVGANTFYVRGLPFVSSSSAASEGSVKSDQITFPTNRTYLTATMGASDTWISITGSGSGQTDSALNVASITSGSGDLAFSITYFV